MEANFLGYLLDALEPGERRAVEEYLECHPEEQQRVELLRQALEPLAADQDTVEPPPGLWVRTLARVAEYRCDHPPRAPLPRGAPAHGPARWRWADAAVAAGILLCVGLMIPPGLNYIHYRQQVVACTNNLRGFAGALEEYSSRHGGRFPDVTAQPAPLDVAGVFVPILKEEGLLPDDVSQCCPARGHFPTRVRSLSELRAMNADDFESCVAALSGCYAYSLGYEDETGRHGPQRDDGHSQFTPIMADRPPETVDISDTANSPNHGGRGQNVLYADGHCAFFTKRTVGYDGDDIFLNQDHQVGTGKGWSDAVLGRSSARP